MQPEAAREKVVPACQAVSDFHEPCDSPATKHCEKCNQWFCDAHAEDDERHVCVLEEGDIGGEA